MADKDTAAAPAAAAEPARASLVDAIERLYVEHFHGSVVARNTEHLNHCRRFCDAVKALVAAA